MKLGEFHQDAAQFLSLLLSRCNWRTLPFLFCFGKLNSQKLQRKVQRDIEDQFSTETMFEENYTDVGTCSLLYVVVSASLKASFWTQSNSKPQFSFFRKVFPVSCTYFQKSSTCPRDI